MSAAAQIFGRDSSFWQIKFVQIYIRSGALEKTKKTLTLVLNIFSWLSKTNA